MDERTAELLEEEEVFAEIVPRSAVPLLVAPKEAVSDVGEQRCADVRRLGISQPQEKRQGERE